MAVISYRIRATVLAASVVPFSALGCNAKADLRPVPFAASIEGPRSGMGDVRIFTSSGAPSEAPRVSAFGCSDRTRAEAKNPTVPGSDACYQRYDAVGAVTLDGARHCLGTLIGSRTVLTAAHCVPAAGAIGFAVGCWLDHALDLVPVTRAERHPSSVVEKHVPRAAHDLAVLCLERPLSVSPIALPRASLGESDINANRLIFMGYGPAPFLEDPPMMRRKAAMRIRRPAESFSFFFDEPRVAVWPHDSGGPVILDQADGLVVLGVVSQGDEGDHCPTAASRVDKDRDWILEKRAACGD